MENTSSTMLVSVLIRVLAFRDPPCFLEVIRKIIITDLIIQYVPDSGFSIDALYMLLPSFYILALPAPSVSQSNDGLIALCPPGLPAWIGAA